MSAIIRSLSDLKGVTPKNLPAMEGPSGVLLCPPDHYDVLEVKNPMMAQHLGRVDKAGAAAQWAGVRDALSGAGFAVSVMEPGEGLEDMVFTANPSFAGRGPKGEKICVLGSMRHPSRRQETALHEAWFSKAGYKIKRLKTPGVRFEGGGDAVWHPGRRLLWGGHGFRTEPEAYEEISEIFDTTVVLLKLSNERFYHLDTCFCPLTQDAALIYPPAFERESLELILRLFPMVLVAKEAEAAGLLCCNAVPAPGKKIILQKGADGARAALSGAGMIPVEVETGEFLKSGGSAFCMKAFLY